MGAVSRVAGTAGSFTYRLNVAPDTVPTVTAYADPARTVDVTTLAVSTTPDPAAFAVGYPASLPAGTYYLIVSTTVAGVLHVDADDTLTLVPVNGGVGDEHVPWRPSLEEVHALIARRAAFTDTSRPTRSEVERVLEHIVGEVRAELVGPLPASLHELARSAVAHGVAAAVERSYTPEQALGDDAPAQQLQALYVAKLGRLRTLAGRLGLTLDPSVGTDGAGGSAGGPARSYRTGTVRVRTADERERLRLERLLP